jgi:restriction system protein
MSPSAIWVVRAGKHDEAKSLFLNEKNAVLALGWNEMPDLSTLPPTRESFKSLVAKMYPTAKPGVIPNYAGQLFRFIHEMKEGDKVLYPCKSDRMIYFGTVTGKYVHKQESKPFAHHRAVNWIKSIPRTKFSQGALYEIGSALTVFQVSTFAEEVFGIFQGQNAPVPVTEDPTVAQVQSDIQDTTRDFIIKTLAQQSSQSNSLGFSPPA